MAARQDIVGSKLYDNVEFRPRRKHSVTVDSTAGALTLTAAMLFGGIIVRDPNGAGRSDVTPTAALLVAAGLRKGTAIDFTVINNADAAETITMTAGTGVTFGASQRTHTIVQNGAQAYWLLCTEDASGSEACVVYELGGS